MKLTLRKLATPRMATRERGSVVDLRSQTAVRRDLSRHRTESWRYEDLLS